MMTICAGTTYASTKKGKPRVKFASTRDTMPSEVHHYHEFTSTGEWYNKADVTNKFFEVYKHARVMESCGIDVCIDFGRYFYETGMESYDVKVTDER